MLKDQLIQPFCRLDASFLPHEAHSHDTYQLLFAINGSIQIATDNQRLLGMGEQAILIPPYLSHQVTDKTDQVQLINLYVSQDAGAKLYNESKILRITPLLREMINYVGRQADTPSLHAQKTLLDLIADAEVIESAVKMPEDKRALLIAQGLRQNPSDNRTLEEWGKIVGASSRTLMRLFHKETALSFRQWRLQLRMQLAQALIDEGKSMTEIAFTLGYESLSAFSRARKEQGESFEKLKSPV